MTKVTVKTYYEKRFSQKENERRQEVWKVLCESFFQKYITKRDVVLDVGAGYGEFINNIKCGKKIVVDINPDVKSHVDQDVKVFLVPATKIPSSLKGKIDVVFMSNFLEHLSTKEELLEIFAIVNSLLSVDGKFMILQPNIDLVKEAYWDFIDHKIPLNKKSLVEALNITGFEVKEFIERFLPYTSKTNLPFNNLFVSAYLHIPSIVRPFAGQSFVLAEKMPYDKK